MHTKGLSFPRSKLSKRESAIIFSRVFVSMNLITVAVPLWPLSRPDTSFQRQDPSHTLLLASLQAAPYFKKVRYLKIHIYTTVQINQRAVIIHKRYSVFKKIYCNIPLIAKLPVCVK